MEAHEEVTHILRGKRTKRPRPASPLALTMASTSFSSGGDCGGAASSYSSFEFTKPVEVEEEDMANCLILLAQGRNIPKPSSSSDLLLATASSSSSIYECKTCDKSFPSFQALGGHRASHNRPKTEEKESPAPPLPPPQKEEFKEPLVSLPVSRTNTITNSNKSKIHECSICGAEFTSGQALGGHMRRHRTVAIDHHQSHEVKKPKKFFTLDLNLPAPEESSMDHREPKFPFASSKGQVIVFSASSLVDCHY